MDGSSCPAYKPGTNRLYSSRVCAFSQRPRLILHHKNIPHEIVNIDLENKPEWFLKLSPFGKVPILQRDDIIVCQSKALVEYLDDAFPGEKLQATEPDRKAWDRVLLENYPLFIARLHKILIGADMAGKVEECQESVNLTLKSIKYYEDELAKRDTQFFGGAKPMMIDFLMWPFMERLTFLHMIIPKVHLTYYELPRMAAWFNAMLKVPAVKKEMHDGAWHYQIYKLWKKGKPYQDYGLKDESEASPLETNQ